MPRTPTATNPARPSRPAASRKRPATSKSRPAPEATAPGATADRAERIRQAAFAFYEQRGQAEGNDLEDWLRAEALVDAGESGDGQAAASAVSGH